MKTLNYTLNYVVTLSNNSMPFSDDARYDIKDRTFWKETFITEKEAKRFFKSKAKELDLRKTGMGSNQYGNSQYELYLSAQRVY